jgi:integrase
LVKNGEHRLVILNDVARRVIEKQRGKHPKRVFTYRGRPINGMNNKAWNGARQRANLVQVRVHDLKHTFGRRLRSAGVSFEDRQDLLGHKSARITTHYSSAEILNLWKAANSVCGAGVQETVSLLKTALFPNDAKVAQTSFGGQFFLASNG